MPKDLLDPLTARDEETSAAAARVRLAETLAGQVAELTLALASRTRELSQSEARFRDVIERNADAIVVVDREGVVRFANHHAAELFGRPREELIGGAFGFPLVAGDITELDLRSDGAPRVAEMRVVTSQWEGRTAYIASLRDVTGRKQAEQDARRLISEQAARVAAEKSARRFRLLAECSARLSSSLDYETTLAALPRLCVPGLADWAVVYTADEHGVVQRLEVAHRDPAKAEAARRLRERRIAPGGPLPVVEALKTGRSILARDVGDGALASIAQDAEHLALLRELGLASYMIVPMIARGHALGAIMLASARPARPFGDQDLAFAEDLAARTALGADNARLYREAQELNQTKTDFLAVISHDVRTPLTAIIGYAGLLEMGIPDALPEGSRQPVQRIRTSAKHLLYLMDELLAFARVDAGREELRLTDVDVRDVARDVAAVMEPLASGRALLFRLELPASPVPLRTDPDKLRQVLVNLGTNALKYTPQGEVRLVVLEPVDGSIAVRVQDTGVGIAPEHHERIFEPFWQISRTQRTPESGTGLGLSVVRRLVRLLGGKVSLTSAPGSGSTFEVTLPDGRGGPVGT